MTLPAQVQTLVDQIVQVCGWQAHQPIGLDISMDDKGVVHRVEPRIALKREKSLDNGSATRA